MATPRVGKVSMTYYRNINILPHFVFGNKNITKNIIIILNKIIE